MKMPRLEGRLARRLGWAGLAVVFLVFLACCNQGSRRASIDGEAGTPIDLGEVSDGSLVDMGRDGGEDGGTDAMASNSVVSAVMARGFDHTLEGWPYHVTSGSQMVLRVREDGRVSFLSQVPCEGYRMPLDGELTPQELDELRSLFALQRDFVALGQTVCQSCAQCGGEYLSLGWNDGTSSRASARPAFRPIAECSPGDRPVHAAGTLALTDWMRAHMDDPAFVARLAPGLSEVIRVTRVDRTQWEAEGRPVPPPVKWTFTGVNLAQLEATVRPQDREPFVDYAGADRADLWALCLAGYGRWTEVTFLHDACMDVAVFAAEEGDETYLLACGAPPALSVFSPSAH